MMLVTGGIISVHAAPEDVGNEINDTVIGTNLDDNSNYDRDIVHTIL